MAASTSLATVCAPAFLFPVLLLLFVASCSHGKRGEVASDNALNPDLEEVFTCWYCSEAEE